MSEWAPKGVTATPLRHPHNPPSYLPATPPTRQLTTSLLYHTSASMDTDMLTKAINTVDTCLSHAIKFYKDKQ